VLDHAHVTRLVAQSDAAPQISRSGGTDKYTHVSSLIGACLREHAISQQHGGRTATTVSGPMRMIWAIGRAVEKHIREGVIQARGYQGVYGQWACPCEAVLYVGTYAERRCGQCHRLANRYLEPILKDDFYRVTGAPDLTLIEMGYYMPCEIKSMNKEQFDKLDRPLADHILQGCAYRWLYEQMGFPVMDIVPIIYGRKDFKFGGSRAIYKEYHVNYFDWEGQVASMMANARVIASHYETGTLPPRQLCQTVDCTRAKDCQRASLCWNMP
jgi:hypothetical protein